MRPTLAVLGAIGLGAWPILGALAWFFHGFKPGGVQGGLSMWQGWICEFALVVVSAYYLVLACRSWSRTLFAVGIVLHLVLSLAVFLPGNRRDGGSN